MHGAEASRVLINDKLMNARKMSGKDWIFDLQHPGKIRLFDGRTGEAFDNPVTM